MEVKELSVMENVFKGSSSGLFITNYKVPRQPASFRLKPEQVDGDFFIRSDGSSKSGPLTTPGVRYSPDKLQTICD